MRKSVFGIAAILLVLLCITLLLSLGAGSVMIPSDVVWQQVITGFTGENAQVSRILFDIRLPRSLFAAMAGASLGLTGLLMQTISQNDLADPYILGVSSGAGAGAVICIVTGLSTMLLGYGVYIGAFVGAALATASVLLLSGRNDNPLRLVLMGIGVSAIFSALTMFAIYAAKDEAQVRSAMFWLLGSLTGIQWKVVPVMMISLVFLMLFCWLYRHELDIMLLGSEEARSLGMSYQRLQRMSVIMASVSAAVVTSIAGVIGFVGLIVPHMARRIGRPDHASMLWVTVLLGALVMVVADALARSLFRPEELPIGILTSFLGAPVFLWIIWRQYAR